MISQIQRKKKRQSNAPGKKKKSKPKKNRKSSSSSQENTEKPQKENSNFDRESNPADSSLKKKKPETGPVPSDTPSKTDVTELWTRALKFPEQKKKSHNKSRSVMPPTLFSSPAAQTLKQNIATEEDSSQKSERNLVPLEDQIKDDALQQIFKDLFRFVQEEQERSSVCFTEITKRLKILQTFLEDL